jgi:hypothetical protein
MKRFLFALALVTSIASAQIVPGTSGVTTHTMGDDGYVSVPLKFGFPFYGKTFTHSFMFDNGVVGLYDPIGNVGCNPQNNYCGGQQWSAPQPNTNMGSQFSYMIAPLWADIAPNPNTKYYTQGTADYQRYMWENIHEYYSGGSRLNTFGLELKPSGSIDAYYQLVNINTSNTFIGTIGNPSAGEWNTIAYHPYGTVLNQIPNWSLAGTGANPCTIDPLSSPSCPGYAAAYLTQQCSISPLYNAQCPGYAQAYYTQQCTANPLYDVNCPGYASAYLTYQCSVNPLYSTTCEGYESAYFNQQCSANSLYSTSCPGYAEAYFAQQCSINGLYSTSCPNYATAYATQQALKQSTPTPSTTTTTSTTTASTPTTDSSGEIKVAVVADQNVNSVINTTATSASPAQAATATVPLVQAPAPATTTAVATTSSTEQKKEEKNANTSDSTSSSSTSTASTSTTSDTKTEAKPTARQELQARREAAAKAKAVEDGKNLASTMGKVADIESQKQVQNVVIAAMGYTPGFDAYRMSFVPDGANYKPYVVYANQRNVDNKRLSWGLMGPSDRLHNELVDSQYNRGN